MLSTSDPTTPQAMIRKNAVGSVGAGDANARNSSSASAAVAAEPTTVASNPSGLTPPERPRCIGWRVRMLTGSSLLYTPTSDAQVSAVQAASAPADTTNSHGSPVVAKAAAQAKNGRLLASTCRSLRGSPSSLLGFKAWEAREPGEPVRPLPPPHRGARRDGP